jgi:hypothetical protein
MKKLLVTLGCSLTEGVGCYIDNKSYDKQELIDNSFDNFHRKGWPPKLCKKLGFNKLINLGFAGYSISGNLKVFVENFLNKDFSNYEIHIIWYLPEPSRISFYVNNDIKNYNISNNNSLTEEIIKLSENPTKDFIREQIFYMKIMENFCKFNNWNLYFLCTCSDIQKQTKKIYNSKYFIKQKKDFLNFGDYSEFHDEVHSKHIAFCGHPNELGYEVLSEKIYKSLLEKNSTIKGTSKKFINIWNGKLNYEKNY